MSETNRISRVVSPQLRGIIEEALIANWEAVPAKREAYGHFTQSLPNKHNQTRSLSVEQFIAQLEKWIDVGGEFALGADDIPASALEALKDFAENNKKECQNKIDYVMLTPRHDFGLN